jgi:hypothetical protein
MKPKMTFKIFEKNTKKVPNWHYTTVVVANRDLKLQRKILFYEIWKKTC